MVVLQFIKKSIFLIFILLIIVKMFRDFSFNCSYVKVNVRFSCVMYVYKCFDIYCGNGRMFFQLSKIENFFRLKRILGSKMLFQFYKVQIKLQDSVVREFRVMSKEFY